MTELSGHRDSKRWGLGFIIFLLILASCAPEKATSPSPSPTVSPSATPTLSPTPTVPPAPTPTRHGIPLSACHHPFLESLL